MSSTYPMALLGTALTQHKEFIEVNDFDKYKRCRVQLHAKGVILRDEVQGSEIKTKKQQICKTGQFLVAEIDAKVGGFGIVPGDLDGAIVSSHYFLFDLNQSIIDQRYLDFFVRTPAFRDQVQAQGSTNYAAIRPNHVLEYRVPLPNLDEQRRIVERIQKLAAKIEEARGLRSYSASTANALLSALISSLYTAEANWRKVRDAVSNKKGAVRSGPFGSQLHHNEFVESGVAAIGTRDVRVNRFTLQSNWYVTPEKFEDMKRYEVFPGDVLCTIVGGSIGRFCIVPKDVPLAFTTKHVQALSLDSSVANPQFASYMLNYHRKCRQSLFSRVEGSAQPSLNASKLLATELPLPPLAEQRHVVEYVQDFEAKVDSLKHLQAQTSAELDAMLPSILDKAFKGEL